MRGTYVVTPLHELIGCLPAPRSLSFRVEYTLGGKGDSLVDSSFWYAAIERFAKMVFEEDNIKMERAEVVNEEKTVKLIVFYATKK